MEAKEEAAKKHESAVSKMKALRNDAESLVQKYNELFQDGKNAEAAKVAEEIEQKCNEYTSTVQTDCFEICKQSGNPMMVALDMMEFTTIAVKDIKTDGVAPIRQIVEKTRRIDLYKLHKYCDGIGADHNWIYMVEQFNLQLTIRGTKDIIKDPKKRQEAVDNIVKTYALSNAAKEISLGKDPTSNTQLLKTLNAIVAAMVGMEYKATSQDVAWLKSAYAKEGRVIGQLVASNHKTLRGLMMVICHNITHPEMEYSMSYKQAKA